VGLKFEVEKPLRYGEQIRVKVKSARLGWRWGTGRGPLCKEVKGKRKIVRTVSVLNLLNLENRPSFRREIKIDNGKGDIKGRVRR